MRLNLKDIIEVPGGSVSFETDLDTENIDFPGVESYKTVPHASGRVYNRAGIIEMSGLLQCEMQCICDRCGNLYDCTKQTSLDAELTTEPEPEDPMLFSIEGDEVDLDEILTTLFILDMESKHVCKEDCKGLCCRCGKNLNDGPCGCQKEKDPRFAVLEQLLDK